jgi:uncharacterized membrane protein
MGDNGKSKTYKNRAGDCGIIWLIGWLFSIGFLKLAFWKAVLALILWPYYIGDILSQFIPKG